MALISLIPALLFMPQATSADIEVPFRIGEDAIIVDATVNGKPVSLMFDTGFSGSVIVNNAINLGKPTGVMNLRDFVGTFEAPTIKLTSLKLGNKKIDHTGMEAVSSPLGDMSHSYNTHTDGIMGFEVIQKYVTEINFQKNKFIFHPKTLDITKRKPDNKRTFLARMLPMGHASIEMEVLAPTGKKLILALDTGNAFYATTHKDVLERTGLWEEGKEPRFMKSAWVASGPVDSWYKEMSDLVIFGVPVPKSTWSIIDRPASSAEGDGTVGFGFLKNFNITIDYDRRRVWLENFTGQFGNEEVGEIGISIGMDDRLKRVRVWRVAPDSPAEKAGIKVGDHVLSIEGAEVADMGYRRLAKLLEGPSGSKIKLALSRNGHLMRYELERTRLVN